MNKLKQFATTLLKDRLEPNGFKRKGNAWFKVIPDVLLCVEVRKLRYDGFDVTFGIVPFVCIKQFNMNIGCFQSESAFSRAYRNDVIAYHEEINGRAERGPRFSYSIDSTRRALSDDRRYDILLRYWGDAYEKTIEPFLLRVKDLDSAVKAIGDYTEFEGNWDKSKKAIVHERSYFVDHMPVFMKLGNSQEAMKYWQPFISLRIHNEQEQTELERNAKESWSKGELDNPFVWYWLMKNNDTEGMKKVVEELEAFAEKWLKKNKLL